MTALGALRIAALAALLLSGCASSSRGLAFPSEPAEGAADCHLGGECLMRGKLRLLGGGVGSATLIVEGDCVELAIPPGFLESHRRWDGKDVNVYGRIYARSPFPDMVWEKFEDRVIEGGMCGDRAIYVVGIERANFQD